MEGKEAENQNDRSSQPADVQPAEQEVAEAENQDDKSSQPADVQPAVQTSVGADSQVEGSSQPACEQPVVKAKTKGPKVKVVKEETDHKNSEDRQHPDVKPVVKKKKSSKAEMAAGEPDLQKDVNKLIIDFICDGVLPFSVVEQEAFKKLVNKLNPGIKVISQNTVTKRIHEAAEDMKKNLIEELRKVKYIASTADCWLDRQKQYLGVTCHWIDEESLERKSASLACKRLSGSQTYDKLGPAIYEVYRQYKIEDRVVRTTTDNARNFITAFKIFGAQSDAEGEEYEEYEDEGEDEADKNAGSCGDEEYEVDEDDSGTDDASELAEGFRSLEIGNDEDKIDQDTNSRGAEESSPKPQLPPHQQCACHLLHLIVTEDLKKLQDEAYLLLYNAVFAKCKGIWNKAQRSHLASEVVEKTYKLKIIAPKAGRWNSTYFAFKRIIKLIDKKGEEVFEGMCKEIKVEMLSSEEIAFLRKYCDIMRHLVIVSNAFQSESKIWLGSLLPKIYRLQHEFAHLETSSEHHKPLIRALQDGLKRRFGEMMKDPELAAAAILLPEFKTTWTDGGLEQDVINAGLNYVRQHVTETTELETYLKSSRDEIQELHDSEDIKKLSLRLNAALPASAACERLFSIASKVFASSRTRAKPETLENQLLLKMNKAFRN